MTKSELIATLKDYPDDATVEVVQFGSHYDINCVVKYNDYGIIIAELIINKEKTVPESIRMGIRTK